jgi:hypothetical protein
MDGDDLMRSAGFSSIFLAQPSSVIVNGTSERKIVIAPDFVKQLIARHGVAAIWPSSWFIAPAEKESGWDPCAI